LKIPAVSVQGEGEARRVERKECRNSLRSSESMQLRGEGGREGGKTHPSQTSIPVARSGLRSAMALVANMEENTSLQV